MGSSCDSSIYFARLASRLVSRALTKRLTIFERKDGTNEEQPVCVVNSNKYIPVNIHVTVSRIGIKRL